MIQRLTLRYLSQEVSNLPCCSAAHAMLSSHLSLQITGCVDKWVRATAAACNSKQAVQGNSEYRRRKKEDRQWAKYGDAPGLGHCGLHVSPMIKALPLITPLPPPGKTATLSDAPNSNGFV